MYAFGSNSMKRCFVPLQLEWIVKFLSTFFTSHSIMYIEFMSFESLRSSKTPLALVTMEVSLIFMFCQNMFIELTNIFELFLYSTDILIVWLNSMVGQKMLLMKIWHKTYLKMCQWKSPISKDYLWRKRWKCRFLLKFYPVWKKWCISLAEIFHSFPLGKKSRTNI